MQRRAPSAELTRRWRARAGVTRAHISRATDAPTLATRADQATYYVPGRALTPVRLPIILSMSESSINAVLLLIGLVDAGLSMRLMWYETENGDFM